MPTRQLVQAGAPAALHVPIAQKTHRSEMCDKATNPASERYFPVTHDVQDAVVSAVALLHLPAAQIKQSDSSSWFKAAPARALYLPAGQSVHAVGVPIVAVYVPIRHSVQAPAAAALKVPIAQSVHNVAPARLYVPATHVAQSVEASWAAALTPASGLYVPRAQAPQVLDTVAPTAVLNFPTPQIVQSMSSS